MKKWNKGPPPSKGWWPASACRERGVYRWWNGYEWSVDVYRYVRAEEAARRASFGAPYTIQDCIEWAPRPDSWPQRSKT